jgi:2-phospho-L-lactate/phosphoenolpyruvate guanylyltransferase
MTADGIWAVLPVKRFVTAKMRLAGLMSDEHRCALAQAMMRDVLAALAGCPTIAGITVVTSDDRAADIAAAVDAKVVNTGFDRGHTAAVQSGVGSVYGRATNVLVLSTDIPLVRCEDIALLVSHHAPGPAVTLARAVADGGTNAILVSPPDVIGFQFGTGSESRHIEAARQVGATVRSLTIPRMAFDIDRPDDVTRFLEARSSTFTYRLFRQLAAANALSLPVPERQET